MYDLLPSMSLPLPPEPVVRGAVAAVWLYEGFWCKVLAREPNQLKVVEAVPKLGPVFGKAFLLGLGVVETLVGVWVLSGLTPRLCAMAQTVLLVTLNLNGLLWARRLIRDPAGMIVKNVAFLVLAWVNAWIFEHAV